MGPPCPVGQDHDVSASGVDIVRPECPPESGLHPEDIPELGRGVLHRQPLRPIPTGHVRVAAADRDDRLERTGRGPIEVDRPGRVTQRWQIDGRGVVLNLHDPVGVGVGQGLEHHCVNQGEDGHRCPNAQTQRQRRNAGKPGSPHQRAHCHFYITDHHHLPFPPSHVAASRSSSLPLVTVSRHPALTHDCFGQIKARPNSDSGHSKCASPRPLVRQHRTQIIQHGWHAGSQFWRERSGHQGVGAKDQRLHVDPRLRVRSNISSSVDCSVHLLQSISPWDARTASTRSWRRSASSLSSD